MAYKISRRSKLIKQKNKMTKYFGIGLAFFGLGVNAVSAQVATSTVTGLIGDVGTNVVEWVVDVLPTFVLYVVPLMLIWMFARWLIGKTRGG